MDYLLTEGREFTDEQISMLVWETIIETSDTTLVTTEWALYELAKDPERQVCFVALVSCSMFVNLVLKLSRHS